MTAIGAEWGTAVAQGLPPGAPQLFATQVTANPVTLTWAAGPGGAPSQYVIVAGTTPGAADLGTFPMGLATAVTANAPVGVPIFVRVVAQNAVGSAASNQINFSLGGGTSSIPQRAAYRVQIDGAILQSGGVTSTFSIGAALFVLPSIDPAAVGVRNGPNPVDIAIFTDSSPILGTAGALYFGTNTSFCQFIGCRLGLTAVDTSFVTVDPGQGLVNVVVDGNVFGLPTARLNTFNIFNARTSIVAQIYNIIAGQMALQFGAGGQTIRGAIALGGTSGFSTGFVTTVYQAQLSGVRVQ
jgi:hypothetical protein